MAAPAIRRSAARRTLTGSPHFVSAEQRREQRFFMEPNNYACGGVRFNLAGREGDGFVEQHELEGLVESLREDLLALVNVDTGGPVVRGVEPVERWYPERRRDTDRWPDLFVDWERSALIENVWSPKVGLVHAPYTQWRTGDHVPTGELLMAGPGLPAGPLGTVDMTDLAPTLMARLGVPLPDVDGSSFLPEKPRPVSRGTAG